MNDEANNEEVNEEAPAQEAEASVGIKETQEALKGAGALLVFILSRLKDGAGIDDAMAIFAKFQTDEEFKKVLADAYEGADKIKGEVKDIDLMEGLALGKDVIDLVPQILEALKK